MIALGVGGVGRHRDAAGGHDREVGDQPFGPVLADQHDPVAGLQADALQRCGERRDLPRRLGPADRLPRAVALGPQERLVALLARSRQEQRNEVFGNVRAAEPSPVRRLFRNRRAFAARIGRRRPSGRSTIRSHWP